MPPIFGGHQINIPQDPIPNLSFRRHLIQGKTSTWINMFSKKSLFIGSPRSVTCWKFSVRRAGARHCPPGVVNPCIQHPEVFCWMSQIKRFWVDMHPNIVNYNNSYTTSQFICGSHKFKFQQFPNFKQNLFLIALGWITGSVNPRTNPKTQSNYPAKWPSVCFCPWGARLSWHQIGIAFK